jgi:LPXTG-motif cell wall-anchored protein
MAQKIVCAQDAVNRTSYWYSEAVRGEVKREELDGSTGVITTYELTRYHRAQEPAFLLGTDTGLAMVLAGISMVLLAAAAIIFWRGRKRDVLPPEKGGPGKSI